MPKPKNGEAKSWNLPAEDQAELAARLLGVIDSDQQREAVDEGWYTDQDGKAQSRLWNVVRMAKSFFKVDQGIMVFAFECVDHIVKSRVDGGWRGAYGIDRETAYYEFVDTWKKVRFDPNKTPLQLAWEKALMIPIQTVRSQQHATPRYDKFIALAGWLQHTAGDRPIFLPCREIAQIMETDKREVSRWRGLAIDDGYLAVVKAHKFVPGKRGEATEFRFLRADWFEQLARNYAP